MSLHLHTTTNLLKHHLNFATPCILAKLHLPQKSLHQTRFTHITFRSFHNDNFAGKRRENELKAMCENKNHLSVLKIHAQNPNLETANILLETFKNQNSPSFLSWKITVYYIFVESSTPINLFIIDELIDLCKLNNTTKIPYILDYMQKFKYKISKKIFSTFTRISAILRDQDFAKKLVNIIISDQLDFEVTSSFCEDILIVLGDYGCFEHALKIMDFMKRQSIEIDSPCFCQLFQSCISAGVEGYQSGLKVYTQLQSTKFIKSKEITKQVIRMFAKCGDFKTALQIFSNFSDKSVSFWNFMMELCVQVNQNESALQLFLEIRNTDTLLTETTYTLFFTACSKIGSSMFRFGEAIHLEVIQKKRSGKIMADFFDDSEENSSSESESDLEDLEREENEDDLAAKIFPKNANKTDILKKVRDLEYSVSDLQQPLKALLQNIAERIKVASKRMSKMISTELINAIMRMYIVCGKPILALRSFKLSPYTPNEESYSLALQIYELALQKFPQKRRLLLKKVIRLQQHIKEEKITNINLSNAFIHAYSNMGFQYTALRYFDQSDFRNIDTYDLALQICSKIGPSMLDKGKEIDHEITTSQLHRSVTLMTSLIQMYDKCGTPSLVLSYYDRISTNPQFASIDKGTIILILKACENLKSLSHGKKIHEFIKMKKWEDEKNIHQALNSMYTECSEEKKMESVK